ncbi:MAG: MurR/RpiR family transcriptional regulator, partial [Sebaldella sp.]|nr:MurR/RpiR family transcriptional regulator [Sebaldella sp.]
MIIKLTDKVKSELTNSEEQVVKYINENEKKLVNMSIVDIAEETFTSPATVSRAIKKCGLNGFIELRYTLSKNTKEEDDSKDINEIFSKSLIETRQTIENLSVNGILEVLELIKKSEKIIVLARGLTELVAEEFSLKLQLMDFNVFKITDPNIMKKISKDEKRDQLYIIFTLKGEDEDIIESARNAHKAGAKVVVCCCGIGKEFRKYTDHI